MRLWLPVFMLSAACSSGSPNHYAVVYTEEREVCADRNPLRNAYFGDTHVHTALSFDAWTHGVRNTPADAYRFAQGEQLLLPPLDAEGNGTTPVRLDRPLDFTAVTDHAEFFGEVQVCTNPSLPGYNSAECAALRQGSGAFTFGTQLAALSPERLGFCQEDDVACNEQRVGVWGQVQAAAEEAYDRSSACRFTTFVAYEWSGAPDLSNLHRNVIFRNHRVPAVPTSYYEQPDPTGLHRDLESACLEGLEGCDVLMIPHNSNLSNGKMFLPESLGVEDAKRRALMEPLVEIFQHKGGSECVNGLALTVGASDELCNFEDSHVQPLTDCGEGTGEHGLANIGCVSGNDYVRTALVRGLQEEERLGVNPFKLGISAATDTHNATPGLVSERQFVGHSGDSDVDGVRRLDGPTLPPGGWRFNPGGLTGVWAQENSRDAIFTAMRRKEVWGTSGPRITVRFFGGFGLDPGLCSDPGLVEKAYGQGVPMGSDLPSTGTAAPTFVVSALADPGSAEVPGVPLAQLQIIKGWLSDDGEPHIEVFDLLTDQGSYATDPASCTATGSGATSMCSTWTDPHFNPEERAFYYARVVEYPTCRWSTYACLTLAAAGETAQACDDPEVPKLIEERAWTSPIWFAPL